MVDFRIIKRTIEPGWAEIHIITKRPLNDSPDFDLYGQAARMKIAKVVLSMAAGIGMAFGDDKFEHVCIRFAKKHGLLVTGN